MAWGTSPQDQGVPDHLYSRLHCSHVQQTVDRIALLDRERGLDEPTVQMLMESIEKTGLRQPIGLREMEKPDENGCNRILIWGRHRYEAWHRLFVKALQSGDEAGKARWHTIPCLVFKKEVGDDLASLMELQENIDRKDLTPAERESAMAKRDILMEKISGTGGGKKGNVDKKAKVDKSTVSSFSPPSLGSMSGGKRGSADYKLLERRYATFKSDATLPGGGHGKPWNKQTEPEYKAFRQWLVDAEKREAQARAEKDAEKRKSETQKALDAARHAIQAAVAAGASQHDILQATVPIDSPRSAVDALLKVFSADELRAALEGR